MKPQTQRHEYSLRLAESRDWIALERMCRDFHSESPYSEIPYSESRVRQIFDQYLSSDKTEILVLLLEKDTEVCGTIVAISSQLPFSEARVASELIWWVDHEHRKRRGSLSLFKAYEFWAEKIGCTHTSAVSTEGTTQLDSFYSRSGYLKAETTFVKSLNQINFNLGE